MTRLSRRTATTTRLSPKADRHRWCLGVANIRSGGLSPRKHSPDGATKHTSDETGLLLIYRPRKDERLSWPGWLNCSGRFTHIEVTDRLQAERRTWSVRRPKTGILPTVLRNQPHRLPTVLRNQPHRHIATCFKDAGWKLICSITLIIANFVNWLKFLKHLSL